MPHGPLGRCPGEPRRSARRQKGVIHATCRESSNTKGCFPLEAPTSFQGSTCRMLAPSAARRHGSEANKRRRLTHFCPHRSR